MGLMSYFHGVKVIQVDNDIFVFHKKYASDVFVGKLGYLHSQPRIF